MNGRRVLTSDEIFICQDLPREWVSTPEWRPADANGEECGVYVATLDADSKERWEDEVTTGSGKPDANKVGKIMVSALVRSVVNENGDRLFTHEQMEQLARKSGAVIGRLWQTFRKLNVLTDADVSELAKN